MSGPRRRLPPKWLLLLLCLTVLVLYPAWQARQQAAHQVAASLYAAEVQAAAYRAWTTDPQRPFLEAGTSEGCTERYRGLTADRRVTGCTVTRLPNGFEVDVTLGKVRVQRAFFE